jgi:hypothetical protein
MIRYLTLIYFSGLSLGASDSTVMEAKRVRVDYRIIDR